VHEIGLLGLCKFLVYVLLAVLLAGKFVTGEWFWGGEADVRKTLWKLWPAEQRLFSDSLLAEFDGSDPHKPLYLAVRCVVAIFYPPVRCTRVSRSLALTGLAGQGAGTPLCRPCCVASSAMAKLTLTICFYFRSTETSMMYRVIVASMAQEDPMHSCTLATFSPSPYGCGVLVILTCVSCCDEGLGQAWMRRAHSEPGASRSTARTICAGSPRARSMYVPSSLRPSPKKLWGLFGEGGGATSLVAHLNVSDDGYAPVFGLPFDRA
jgi:hypothetical protein